VPAAKEPLEIWWRGDAGRWSELRSVRWSQPAAAPQEWAVPLDRLPHWNTGDVRRVRVYLRAGRPSVVGAPRLLE